MNLQNIYLAKSLIVIERSSYLFANHPPPPTLNNNNHKTTRLYSRYQEYDSKPTKMSTICFTWACLSFTTDRQLSFFFFFFFSDCGLLSRTDDGKTSWYRLASMQEEENNTTHTHAHAYTHTHRTNHIMRKKTLFCRQPTKQTKLVSLSLSLFLTL